MGRRLGRGRGMGRRGMVKILKAHPFRIFLFNKVFSNILS
jgi:hypothetical protein